MNLSKNKWIIISNCLWIVIVLCLIVFNSQKPSEYKKSIKLLTQQKDSLKTVINEREYRIKTLTTKVEQSEQRLDTVNFVRAILEQKLLKYEKDHSHISTMSTDDNIKFLSDYLSKEVSN